MSDFSAHDLSALEQELIVDFVEWAGEFDRQILDRQTVPTDSSEASLQEAFEFLAPLISQDAGPFDAQLFRLYRLEQEIQRAPTFEWEYQGELPSDARVSPEVLSQFLKKEELEDFFRLAGQMIETLSAELILDEVVEPERRSSSVRRDVERKSQQEREWILYVSGNLSNGNKSEMRRVYRLRSATVHASGDSREFLDEVEVPSDLNRAKSILNDLHERLHGIQMEHRFGDLIA